jgi:hypothetical protein
MMRSRLDFLPALHCRRIISGGRWRAIIDRIFVDTAEGEFMVAQWKLLAATFVIAEKTDGKKFTNALRKLVVADNTALVQQIITLEAELSGLEANIARQEAEMNALVNGL